MGQEKFRVVEEPVSGASDEQTEPAEGDNGAPVIEPETPPADQPADPPAGDPAETPEEPVTTPDPEEPVVTPEEPVVIPEEPEEEMPEEDVALYGQIDAVTPAATTITVEQYEKDGNEAADGTKSDKKLADDAIAEVTYIDGTSADGSKALGGERPVKFSLDLKDGWKEADLAVVAVTAKGGDVTADRTETLLAVNGVYTITTNVAAKAAQGDTPATPAGYSGNITIKITASPVKSTVKLAAAPATGQIVCLAANGTPDATKAITNESGQNLTYAEATADVTLAVSGLSGKYRKIRVKRGGGTSTPVYSSGTKKAGTGDAEKTYDLFTFKPSELAGFSHNADNTADDAIIVTLETAEEAKTLTLGALNAESAKWTAGAVENIGTAKAYINVKADKSAFDADSLNLNEDNYANDGGTPAKDRILAFTVTPGTALKLAETNPVKAEITGANNFKKTVNATKVAKSGEGASEIPEHYEIALKDAIAAADFANGNLTLTIKVDTVVDTAATGVHTITFKGDDLKNVSLGKKVDSSFEKLESSYTAKMDDITFGIKPDPGYTLAKGTDYRDEANGGNSDKDVVTVSYDKVYALQTTDDTPKDVKATVKVTNEELIVGEDSDEEDYLAATFKFKDSTNYKDAAWETGLPTGTAKDKIDTSGMTNSNAEYTIENLEVTVKTEIASGKSGTVTIVSNDADYEVSGDGITKSVGDTYYISEEATLLTLTIASDVEPTVSFDEENDKTAEVKAGEAEGSYVAEIPVSELANDGSTIEDTITITKGTKTLTVNTKVGEAAAAAFASDYIQINGEWEQLDASGRFFLTNGQKAEVTFEAPVGTEITGLTTRLGSADPVKVELKETDKYSVTFPVTMSDDVEVTVSLKKVYAATVTLGSNTEAEEPNAEDVYVIPAGTTGIKVSLFNGNAADADNAVDINYVKIYDGAEIAVTTATVTDNTATIESISDKDTGVLKVDLAAAGSNKIVASVQIKQEKAAAKLAVKDAKNKAVTSVSLMADGPVAKYAVTAADGGRLDYATGNIGIEVVAKADDAPIDTPVTKNDFVEAVLANGELTIKALPAMEGKKDAAVVRLYDIAKRAAAKNDSTAKDKICLMADAITVSTTNPTVIGQKPTVKEATGSDKVLRVELSADKVVAPTSNNKILYKVEIGGTLPEGVDKVQYFEKTTWGKQAQLAEIVVDKSTVDANGKRVEGSAKDFSLKVELVQTTKQTTALTGDALITAVKAEAAASPTTLVRGGDKAIAELKKISTRNPLYETKLKMKPASVTVYTGQTLASAQEKPQTQAQFDKKTGYTVVPYVQFVDTKTGVLQGTSSLTNGTAINGNWSATVDLNGNVAIGYSGYATAAKNLPKDIGLKVTAEYPEGAYAATAIVKIAVANGIHDIEFVSGDYRPIYKSAKGASLKLTPIFNWGEKDRTPKKKTLTYAMGDASGRLPGEPSYSLASEIAAKVKVNQKNGAVTVDKSYDLTKGENTFSVVAMAADYEGNKTDGRRKAVTVEITGTAQSLGDVVIAEYASGSYKVIARNGGTLKAEDFWTTGGSSVTEKYLYVKVLKPTAASKRVYTDDDFVPGVSYATSAKAVLGVSADYGYLTFLKSDKKPVKLTVSAADGSKSKKEMSVTVKGYSKLGLEMFDSNDVHYDARELTHTYDGAMNERFRLTPVAGMWNDYYKDVYGLGYTNLSVTLKGAKMVSKSTYGWPSAIVMTAPEATVTIQDKTDKDVKTVYTIKQDPAADSKAKAPTIKQIGKLTAADVEKARTQGGVNVNFQVTTSDKKNHAREYVMVTPDYTKTKVVNGYSEYSRANEYFLNWEYSKIEQIDDNGKFKLGLNVPWDTYELVPGNYTLIATVGTYENGKFVPAAKGVNVRVNIPGKAAKNSLTVKGKYTLDTSAMAPVDLASGKNIATDYKWTLTNAAVNGNYAMNKIDPKTGKPNKFTEYFQVTGNAVDGFKLGLKPGLTKAQIETITSKNGKADCEGYVTVSSYRFYDDNTVDNVTTRTIDRYLQTKDMKITVTFKNASFVAKTLESSVYVGAETTVKIYESAKSTTPIRLAGAAIVADDKNGGAALGTTATGVEADGETLKVKFASAEAGKTYKVTFKILAADSAYAAMTTEGAKDYKALAASDGRTVTASIKVSGKDDKTKNKVAVTGKAFKITADNFTTAQADTYTLAIPVKSAIEGTTISAAAVPATVKDKPYEGKDIVTAAYDTATGKVTLTVNRGKLVTANAAKGGKFKFAKVVDVPVEFTFADTAVAKETVTLKVTLPNPMTFEKAKEAATKLEPVISAMEDDKLFTNAAGMKTDLTNRINAAIDSALPKDVQATVSRNVTLTEETKDGKTSYKTKVTVFKGATKAEGDYEHDYTFAQAEAIVLTDTELATKISALTASDLKNLGNDYTPAKLLEDVKDALAKQEPAVKIPANLSLSVYSWNLKKATAGVDGSLTTRILVRDRNDVRPYTNGIGSCASAQLQNLTIGKLGDLSVTAGAVKLAVAEKGDGANATGVDYNAIITTALGTTGAKTGVEAALKKAIEDAAKAAIKNPDITVKGFKKIEKADDSDNPTTVTAPAKAMVDVDFKLPTKTENGSVSFILILQQKGMKDLEVNCTTTAKITVTKKAFTSMTVAAEDISGETSADIGITDGKAAIANVDGAKSLKFTATVAGTKLTAADKEVVYELVKQADTTDLEGDNLTLDDIPKLTTLPTGVTMVSNDDGSVTINVGTNVTWTDNKVTLYLRAQKKLTKLYTSDTDGNAIDVADRTKVITIELTKKTTTPAS